MRNNLEKKIKMSLRGLSFKIIRFKKWNSLLKGKFVEVKFSCFKHAGLLVLNDFVEFKGMKKNIQFGCNCYIGKYSIIKADYSDKSYFKVGSNFGCGEFCFFGCAGGIEIGNDVMIGQSVRFHAQNHIITSTDVIMSKQGTTQKGIKVGNDCWIGSGSVILDGITIGSGSVIGANAVVTKNIPPYSVVGGVPAKVIKRR